MDNNNLYITIGLSVALLVVTYMIYKELDTIKSRVSENKEETENMLELMEQLKTKRKHREQKQQPLRDPDEPAAAGVSTPTAVPIASSDIGTGESHYRPSSPMPANN